MAKYTHQLKYLVTEEHADRIKQIAADSGQTVAAVARLVSEYNLKHYSIGIIERLNRNGKDK